jgi:hypothetical protein
MPYDPELADRVRDVLPPGLTERKMFAGIVGSELLLRLGADGAEQALRQEHVREMDFTGRPMKNMVFVEPGGLHGAVLGEWVATAAEHARSLPPKPARGQPA